MGTKEMIFEAAVDLFSRKGYSGTSIREIAREVGIKESSIYNHFSGKGAIFEAIMEYQLEGFRLSENALEGLKESLEGVEDPVEFWMAGARAFLQVQPPLTEAVSTVIFNEMLLNETCRHFVLDRMFRVQKELTEKMFNIMYDMGMIIKRDFSRLAHQYVALIQGLDMEMKLKVLGGEDRETCREKLLGQMIFFIEGLKK